MSALHVGIIGKVNGHFKFKENRAAKLIAVWDELREKMAAMVERGRGVTDQAKHAYATLLMMETGIRIGNEGSAEGFVCENKYHPDYGKTVQTFGVTTLLNRHVEDAKEGFILSFTGKKLVEQNLNVVHPVLVKHRPDGPADEPWLGITYGSLKRFQRKYVGRNFTPKDIRTAKVNLIFLEVWEDGYRAGFEEATRKSEAKRAISGAIETTANRVGHTKGVCKSSYLSGPMLEHLLDRINRNI